MTLRQKMQQAASRAPSRLRDPRRVADFVLGQLDPAGGFKDRSGRGDVYYTVFALEALATLGQPAPVEAMRAFLSRFLEPNQGCNPSRVSGRLDFVHLTCLARCWRQVAGEATPPWRDDLLARVETFRSADRGFNQSPRAEHGTAYGCLLALGAYQDMSAALPEADALGRCIDRLKTPDGGYANELGQGGGLKVATALRTLLLGEVPLDQTIRQGGDHGIPVVISHPDSNPARVFRSVGLTVLQGLEKQA